MDKFIIILDAIIYIALGFALIEVYLKVNKIWKRKHEEQVAESQSLYGLALSLFILFVWTLKYLIIGEYTSIIDNTIYLSETITMMLIGTGMFVKSNKGLSFIQLIKKALHLERKEASYLIKAISGKEQAIEIMNILHQLAWIDNDLDKKELALINEFANAWKIDYSENNPKLIDIPKEFIKKLELLRNYVNNYLEKEPDKEQIAQLLDIMQKLISADNQTTEQEEIIFDEVKGLLNQYLNRDSIQKYFHVLIVPQEKAQESLIKNLKPDAEEIHTAGGIAFSLEKYLSYKYADQMCENYRQKGLFTIVYEL